MQRLLSKFVLWYLRTAAKLQLKKFNPIIIGVAGSSGKSSLARIIKNTLEDSCSVLSGEGKNSETGIPLGILGIHMADYQSRHWVKAIIDSKWKLLTNWKKYDVFIAEMGIDSPVEPKNMSYLLKIITPTIGIVTNISLEHSVYFDTFVQTASDEDRYRKILEMTASQELLLLQSLPTSGTAIVNLDDPIISSSQKNVKARILTISLKDKRADVFGVIKKNSLDEFSMDISWKDKTYSLTIPQLLPEHYAYEFLFSFTTALSLDLPIYKAISSLEKNFSLPPGRFSVFEGIKNTTIIDSSYNNATIEPILGILDLLKKVAGRKRIVAIIGDMRELGSQSKQAHEILAQKLSVSANEIILIGPLLKNYALPFLKNKKVHTQSFDTFTQAKQAIKDIIKENDIVLIKSSQNTLFLERAVELLLKNNDDVEKLCRRGAFWDSMRAKSA